MPLDDIDSREIFLVTVPVDMRKGYLKLAAYAKAYLGLDVATERNYILFINKRAQSLKLIGKRGQLKINLSLGLDHGSFQRIVQRVNEAAYLKLTTAEFLAYIKGYQIMTKRVHP
ncbi:MAG: IS66 family insertion sequence element accessory protein TnpB [Anaerobiospirillum sp.]|nr:IS66 family insertion sequence element accessory protein TnpB [Anaerobiospirillum sp.]